MNEGEDGWSGRIGQADNDANWPDLTREVGVWDGSPRDWGIGKAWTCERGRTVLSVAMKFSRCLPRLLLPGLFLMAGAVWDGAEGAPPKRRYGSKPNVLFVIADDLRDYAGWMGGHAQSVTPNMDALAKRGMRFTNAHCNYALCNPSRTSMLTGMLPSSSGVFGNEQDWRRSVAVAGKATLPAWFRENGYLTAAGGKVFHANHGGPEGRLAGWHGGRRGFEQDEAWMVRFPEAGVQIPKLPVATGQNFNGLDIWHWDWGGLEVADEETDDGQVVAWAAEFLGEKQSKPFFLTVGLYRPHSPWYVPQRYFDEVPAEADIVLPDVKEDDLADVPAVARAHAEKKENDHRKIVDKGLWKSAVRAYLANVRFCDAMLGRVLAALDAGPHAANTIVVFTSDHGWYLGEKQLWHKGRLWEEATRVPLTIAAPKVTKAETVSGEVVALVDVYPTLCELAGLKAPKHLDGQSLMPLLQKPETKRERPAVTCMGGGETAAYAARDRQYRYIRYANGDEELYDHEKDPKEWTNLAGEVALAEVKERLGKAFPKTWTRASRPVSEIVGPVRTGGGAELELQMGDVLMQAEAPDVKGCGVLIETRFDLDPEVDGDSSLISHGDAELGYALHLVGGKATLTVFGKGRSASVSTHALAKGRHHVRALFDGDGVLSIAVPEQSEMMMEAPFEGGFPESLKGGLSAGTSFGVLGVKAYPNSTPFDGVVQRLRLTFTPGQAQPAPPLAAEGQGEAKEGDVGSPPVEAKP
jgi:arylsulfatase A-like enzyme